MPTSIAFGLAMTPHPDHSSDMESFAHLHPRFSTTTLPCSMHYTPNQTKRTRNLLQWKANLSLEGDQRISYRSSEERVYDVVLKQAALMAKRATETTTTSSSSSSISILNKERVTGWEESSLGSLSDISAQVLEDAYTRCGEVCAEYAKTFYLGECTHTHTSIVNHCIFLYMILLKFGYITCRRILDRLVILCFCG